MAGPLAMQRSPSRDIHIGRVESMKSSLGSPDERPSSKKKLQMNKKRESHQGRTRQEVGAHKAGHVVGRISFKSPKKPRDSKKRISPGLKSKVQQLQVDELERSDSPGQLQTNQPMATILSSHTDKPMISQSHHSKDKSGDSMRTHTIPDGSGATLLANRALPGGHDLANRVSDAAPASDAGAIGEWSQQGPPS